MAFDKNITYQLGQGGLGTPQPGQDYISGIIFTSNTVPSGFSYSVAKEVFSLVNAETLGILGDYSDETKASSKLTVGATISVGTAITIAINEPDINGTINPLTLANYTVQAADTTQAALANNLATAINIGTSGYSAGSVTGASFSVTARTGVGPVVNGTTLTITGASLSPTSFSGGVASPRIVENYQISEFFRLNPNGVLWVMYQSSVGTFTNLNLLQNQSGNSIRQFGVYNASATQSGGITTDCDNLQAACTTMFGNYSPASVIYSPNIYNTTDLTTLPNLRARSDNYVSCVIGQDGGNTGAFLALYSGQSVPAYGSVLGLVSLSKVSECIGWVGKFPISPGSGELSVPGIANSSTGINSLYSNLFATSYGLLNQLAGSGYIFVMTRPNITGSFVNDSNCCISVTSDYAYIERNRTIDKAIRVSYQGLVPLVNSPLVLNTDGTLSSLAIANFQNAVFPSMQAMVAAQELSGWVMLIDPTQNVQSTSTIAVQLNLLGVGVARKINVTIGYVLSL